MSRLGSAGRRVVVFAVLVSWLSACATPAARPRPTTPRVVQTPPQTVPVPAQPPAPEPPTAPPPVSIGPRPETPAEPVPGRTAQVRPAAPPTAPPVPPGQRGRFVVLNFDNADIETVVHAASEIVGFNYVLAPDVRGKVTVQTSGRIPQEDVFGVLLAILEVHGFTAVKSENLYKIVRIEGARERAVPTVIGLEPDATRSGDEVVTQIIPVRYSSVTDLGTLLRPLVSARGTLIANRETNILIVTDTAANIRRLLDIIRLVDVEVALDELQIMPVRYADAADLATILNQLFASGRLRRAATTPGAPAPTAPPTPAVPTAPRPTAPGAATGETVGTERTPLIIAERRSNSLVVYARKPELETIRKLLGQLDVNIYGGRRVFVYYAESAKSKDLAATLNAIYGGRETVPTTTPSGGPPSGTRRPGEATTGPQPAPTSAPGGPVGGAPVGDAGLIEGQVRFIADETTNSVIVTTYPRNWPEIEATIRQLDRQPRQVLVEVLVAEITLTDDIRLGIDWAIKSGRFTFAEQSINPSTAVIQPISRTLPIKEAAQLALPGGGLTAFTFATDLFMALVNTLASENKVNVLSNPHVMTSENKKAVINVSDSIPIVTSQQVPIGGTTTPTATATTSVIGTQSIEYRDAGVILTVTPRIGERGTVALDVKQEVNDIGAPEPPTGSRRIIKREAETSVVLLNNQTLVLGGLIQDRKTTEDRGVPFFKNIPIIGYLFGAKVDTTTRTELLILITPRVIGTALDAARITEQYRHLTPSLEETIDRSPRPPTTAPPANPVVPPVPLAPSQPQPAPPPAGEPSAPPPRQ
jgi:general secretion pathway protein D